MVVTGFRVELSTFLIIATANKDVSRMKVWIMVLFSYLSGYVLNCHSGSGKYENGGGHFHSADKVAAPEARAGHFSSGFLDQSSHSCLPFRPKREEHSKF